MKKIVVLLLALLFVNAASLTLPSITFLPAGSSLGTFWNGGQPYVIPATAIKNSTCAGTTVVPCLDLTGDSTVAGCAVGTSCPYGIGITNITVPTGTTVLYPYSDSILFLTCNGCTVNAQGTMANYEGAQAHNHLQVIGNNNKIFALSGGGTDVFLYGTGNTVTGAAVTAENQTGNTWVSPGGTGFAQSATIWRWIGPKGPQDASPFPLTGVKDTFNLAAIGAAGGYDTGGVGQPQPVDVGAIGRHYYCTPAGNCQQPVNYFVDCIPGSTETLAQFLANPQVITTGAAPTLPAKLPPKTIVWPNCTADIHSCPLGPNSIQPAALTTINGVPTIVVGNRSIQLVSGFNGIGLTWINYLDTWALARRAAGDTTATTTIQVWVGVPPSNFGNGRILGGGPGCGQQYDASGEYNCQQHTDTPAEIHEYFVAQTIFPNTNTATTDTLTITISNSGGDSYTATYPVVYVQGGICA